MRNIRSLHISGIPDLDLLFFGVETPDKDAGVFWEVKFPFMVTRHGVFRNWTMVGHEQKALLTINILTMIPLEQFKAWFLHWYKESDWQQVQEILDQCIDLPEVTEIIELCRKYPPEVARRY